MPSGVRYSGTVPRIDVIIPAFNVDRFLVQALESVIAQDFEDWRIILVDDGSTDGTAEIASRYQAKLGQKMLVISQSNAGLPAARNAAIRASDSPLIGILDSDDMWLPCRISRSLTAFENRPEVGLSYGLIQRIDEESVPFYVFPGNLKHAEGKIAPAIFMRQVEFPCPSVTIRRSCLDEVGMFDETMRATEDRDLWFRIALRYDVAFIPEVIASYRTYATSMSADMNRMLQAQLKFIAKHRDAPGCGFVARRVAESRIYKQRGEVFQERGNPVWAFTSAARACSIWPFGRDNLRTLASLFMQLCSPRFWTRHLRGGERGTLAQGE